MKNGSLNFARFKLADPKVKKADFDAKRPFKPTLAQELIGLRI